MDVHDDPSPPAEKIKFDLLGHRRLVFDAEGVTYATDELYPVPLPLGLATVRMSSEGRIPYDEVRWVGVTRKKQWWTLVLAILGCGLGLFWIAVTAGGPDWGPLGFSIGFLLLIGVLPMWLFVRGRPFLAIASESECISFPADRKRRQVRRAVKALRARCGSERVIWQLDSALDAEATWNDALAQRSEDTP